MGDNFVHRLVQSKGDGKLVAVEDQQSAEMDGKVDSLSLEVKTLLSFFFVCTHFNIPLPTLEIEREYMLFTDFKSKQAKF